MKTKQILTEQAFHNLFGQVRGGVLSPIRYAGGETHRYGDGEPRFTIRFNDDDILCLISGDVLMSFGEA